MTDAEKLKRRMRYAAIAGAVLGLVCTLLPPEYQTVCSAIVSVCTGGIP